MHKLICMQKEIVIIVKKPTPSSLLQPTKLSLKNTIPCLLKIILKISLPFPFEDKSFASKITAKMRPSDPRLSCWFAIIQFIYRIVFVTHYQVKLRKNTYALYIFSFFLPPDYYTHKIIQDLPNLRLFFSISASCSFAFVIAFDSFCIQSLFSFIPFIHTKKSITFKLVSN